MAADGSVVFSIGADDAEAQKKLIELRKDIEKLEKGINSATEKRSGISESLAQAKDEAEQTAQRIQEIKAEMADYKDILAGKFEGSISPAEFEARRQQQYELTAELEKQQALYAKQSATVSKLEGQESALTSQIETQTAKLAQQRDEAGEIERVFAKQATTTMPQIGAAIEQVNTSIKKGVKNILRWGFGIRSTFILIRRLRSAIKEGITEYAKNDPETQANLDALKNSLNGLKLAWGAAFAPVVNAVVPILQKLISWLTAAANAISMFFAALRGNSSYKKVIANNDSLAKSYGGAGGAAKDAKKEVMGFDEINKLNDNKSGGGGGGGGALDSLGQTVDENIPDRFRRVIDYIKENIAELETIIGDALLAIGAILLFTWTKPLLGLGMIIAGLAMKYDVIANWDALPDAMKKQISVIDGLLGTALLVIGAILAFSSPASMALGIGLMAAGAVMLGTAVALNWDAIREFVSNNVTEILGILGGALLVIGAILAFSSPAHMALGIGLMAAGAVALGSDVAINWDNIVTKVKDNLGDILTVLGLSLFAIGAILALACPALLPLGIGLMIAGGASFLAGVAVSIDWDKVRAKIQSVTDKIKSYIDSLKQKWENMKTSAAQLKQTMIDKFTEMKEGIVSKFQAARDRVFEIIQNIKDKFANLHIQLPHINLPHIQVSWTDTSQSSIARLLGITAIPNFSIAWYAKGGIVDGATLIGAGEAGKEAIVPLERNTEWIRMVADGIIDGLTGNNKLADYISGTVIPAIANGQIVPPRALSGGGSVFTDGDIQKLVNGLTAALSADGNEQSIKLYLDGRQIAETVTKHQRRMERGYA